MIRLEITAESVEDLQKQLEGFFVKQPVEQDIVEVEPVVENPPLVEVPKEPVISMEQMEKNKASAPEHKEPEQPTIEEVRAALKDLRDRKGSGAVKEILKAYNADSLTALKPEDYLGAMARAFTEV